MSEQNNIVNEPNPFEDKLPQNSELKADRKFKDGLFRFLFGKNPPYALDLYNGLNNTDYKNAEELEIIDLENAFFIKMRNDVAFAFDKTMNLVEQQSTYNPNMPLRGFYYFADLYRKMYDPKDLYTTSLIKIPTPKYIVFYNGTRKLKTEDVHYLYLSDAFQTKEDNNLFEWTATMININKNHSQELLTKCKILSEYSQFVTKVHEYLNCNVPREDAILNTIKYCMDNNILADFLKSYKWEVAYLEWDDSKQADYDDAWQNYVDREKARADEAEVRADKEKARADKAEADLQVALAKLKAAGIE